MISGLEKPVPFVSPFLTGILKPSLQKIFAMNIQFLIYLGPVFSIQEDEILVIEVDRKMWFVLS
jgi:hypothetical protein